MKNILNREDWKQDGKLLLIAGPCSAETPEQLMETARRMKTAGKNFIFRAGIWKPRTRPGSFEGVGEKGLPWLVQVKKEMGFPVATEVATAAHAEKCLEHGIDVLWVGARTTVNPFSVQEIADALRGTDSTVLVKNPINPDIQLWTGALERLAAAGIRKLGAIHRGFQVWNSHPFRNAPAWELVVEMKTKFPELLMLCDPSHICGSTELISYVAQKAIDMDMDGLMIETHCSPSLALSDARQQITPPALFAILDALVYRTASPALNGQRDRLEGLRDKINMLDEEILKLLSQRGKISTEIGELKKEKGMTVLQVGRWEEILKGRMRLGVMMGVREEFVRNVYSLIHQESIRIQDGILNAEPILEEKQ